MFSIWTSLQSCQRVNMSIMWTNVIGTTGNYRKMSYENDKRSDMERYTNCTYCDAGSMVTAVRL